MSGVGKSLLRETLNHCLPGMIAGDIALVNYVYEKAAEKRCGRMIE
jgi:hypothetical protein